MSVQSQRSFRGSPRTAVGRSTSNTDPNVVVLDRFDDIASSSTTPFPIANIARSQSFSGGFQGFSIAPSSPNTIIAISTSPESHITNADDQLTHHFRTYIIRRLIMPLVADNNVDGPHPLLLEPGSTKDVFQLEAVRFLPVSANSECVKVILVAHRLYSYIMQYAQLVPSVSPMEVHCQSMGQPATRLGYQLTGRRIIDLSRKQCNTTIRRFRRRPPRQPPMTWCRMASFFGTSFYLSMISACQW